MYKKLHLLYVGNYADEFLQLNQKLEKAHIWFFVKQVSSVDQLKEVFVYNHFDILIINNQGKNIVKRALLDDNLSEKIARIPLSINLANREIKEVIQLIKAETNEVLPYKIKFRESETGKSKAEKRSLEFNFFNGSTSNEVFWKRTFLNHSAPMFVIEEDNGRIMNTNLAASNFFGIPIAELSKKSISDLWIGHRPKKGIKQILLNEKNTKLKQVKTASKRIKHIELYSNTINFKDTEALLVVLSDVTEKIKAKQDLKTLGQQLIQRSNEIDNFVYKVSHDLRGPLCSIEGLLNLMELDMKDETSLKYVEMISDRVKKLNQFVYSIVTYSENLNAKSEISEVNFRNLLSDFLKEFEFHKNIQKVQIKKKLEDEFVFYSDINRVREIIRILLSNALQFIDSNKKENKIFLKIQTKQDKCIIEVKDNGIGIENMVKAKIFDMFYRGSEISEGAGLGLYILKQIVNFLQGNIIVRSEDRKGTLFKVILPNKADLS